MKSLEKLIFLILVLSQLNACSPDQNIPQDNLSSHTTGNPESSEAPSRPGVTLDGGDQGREGGHFLICDRDANVPDSRMAFEIFGSATHDKAIFLDYFLKIQNPADRTALLDFHEDETDDVRLDRVTKRLLYLFRKDPHMKAKAQRLDDYAASFMERKGEARWIESTDLPLEHELTEDITPAQLSDTNLQIVNEHCQSRFFQAAIYDYSQPEQEVFYYSEFFEEHASRMQKSFRNVHEMLRFTMRNETPQVIALTAYFHSIQFFRSSDTQVKRRIAEISEQTHTSVRFF